MEFVNSLDTDQILDITLATNYLQYNRLFQICVSKIASLFLDKYPEEIAEMLGFAVEPSKEEENYLRSKFDWALK
jgi:hypothetical protein